MRLAAFTVAILCVSLTVLGCDQKGGPAGSLSSERDVYAAMMNRLVEEAPAGSQLLFVVRPNTIPLGEELQFDRAMDSGKTYAEKVAAYVPRATARSVEELVGLDNMSARVDIDQGALRSTVKVTLPKDGELERIFTDGDLSGKWHRFYDLFPGSRGMISFSRVGFDMAEGKAVAYMRVSCGPLCGSTHLFLLQRSWGNWSVTEINNVGVS